jgi:hypothetical protein
MFSEAFKCQCGYGLVIRDYRPGRFRECKAGVLTVVPKEMGILECNMCQLQYENPVDKEEMKNFLEESYKEHEVIIEASIKRYMTGSVFNG